MLPSSVASTPVTLEPTASRAFVFRPATIAALASLGLVVLLAAPRVVHADLSKAWHGKTVRPTSRGGVALVGAAGRVFVVARGAVEAYHASDGKKLWRRPLRGLRGGPGTLAANDHYAYAVSRDALTVLDAASGKVIKTRSARGARSVLARGGAVYLSDSSGTYRLGARASAVLGMSRVSGELRGALGKHALIYRVVRRPKRGHSPKRLVVVDLDAWRAVYSFKLLAVGSHAVARFRGRRLAFFDYSVRGRGRRNARKLFFTEVDYTTQRKLRDISLSKLYKRSARDKLSVVATSDSRVVVANYGDGSARVFALDTKRKRLIWKQRLALVSGLAGLSGSLVAIARKVGGGYELVRIDSQSGRVSSRQALAAAPIAGASPVVVGRTVLVPTKAGLYAFTQGAAVASVAPGGAGGAAPGATPGAPGGTPNIGAAPGGAAPGGAAPGGAAPGGAAPGGVPGGTPNLGGAGGARVGQPPLAKAPAGTKGIPQRISSSLGRFDTYRDHSVGYQIRVPRTWRVAKAHVRHFGKRRYSIPFVRYQRRWRRWAIASSLHVLVRESAGQNVHGLWRSIYAHRRRQDPRMRVLRVIPFRHNGQAALLAIYRMRDASGRVEQVRSFCLVAKGRAYELKARARSRRWRSPAWVEIGDIFKSFRPL